MSCRQLALAPLPLLRAVLVLIASSALAPPVCPSGQPLLLSRPLTIKWHYPSSEISSVAPTEGVGAVYLPLAGGEIVSLRTADGQLVWRTDVGGDVLLPPTADAESLYVASGARSAAGPTGVPAASLRSLSRSSGVILWFQSLPGAVQHTSDAGTSPVLAATIGDTVVGVEKRTGSFRWQSRLPARAVGAPVSNGGRLYLALADGEIICLKLQDGQTLLRYRTQDNITALSSAGDGTLYWAAAGYVNAVTESGGAWRLSWRRRVATEIQSLSLTPDGLLIVSRDNSVTYLRRQNGKRLWKRRLSDRLAAAPVLYEGAGLFAPLGGDACVVLSLRDGRQVNTLYLGANNSVVATPVVADNCLLVPTKLGLLAFATAG